MLRIIKTITIASIICSLWVGGLSGIAQAASATLYLTPSSATVQKGQVLTVKVYEDSGSDPVNAVQANLAYPKNLISYTGYTSSEAFSLSAQNPSGDTGTLRFGRATGCSSTCASVTGKQLVVTITFKTVGSSGTAKEEFVEGSAVVSSENGGGDNILSSTVGGNYKISTADTGSQPPPSSSGGSTTTNPAPSTGSSQPVPASKKRDKKPPLISNIVITDISATSAIVTWKTSEPASSRVMYGLDSKNQIPVDDGKLVTHHKLKIGPVALTPSSIYHFKVISTDASGNKASSRDHSFQTLPASLGISNLNIPNLATKAGIVIAAAIALIGLATSTIWLRRQQRARAELDRHFLDNNPNQAENPPAQPTNNPTIIRPGGAPPSNPGVIVPVTTPENQLPKDDNKANI